MKVNNNVKNNKLFKKIFISICIDINAELIVFTKFFNINDACLMINNLITTIKELI